MINKIIDTFYLLSKEHKLVRQFKYDRLSKGSGTGEENHPLVFLEDPIYVGDSTLSGGSVSVTVNFDVVMTPQAFENYNKKQLNEEECQAVAYEIALSFIARLRNMTVNYDDYNDKDVVSLRPSRWSFVTLRNWYDNAASGVRCTLVFTVDNPINFCDVEENFDDNKEFDLGTRLSSIDTDGAASCVTFDYKLPKFTL